MPTRLTFAGVLVFMLALLALCPAQPAAADTATPTVTYTPMPTRTATPVVSSVTTNPDGSGTVYTNSWTAEGRAIFDAILVMAALFGIRFLYDVAKQWNR